MNESRERDELPLPEYDHIPVGNLQSRIASLDVAEVNELVTYEKEHANRVGVLQVLEHRLQALRDGATPSGSLPPDLPEVGSPGGTSPSVSPQTSGPPINPPSHGNPANPAQPR